MPILDDRAIDVPYSLREGYTNDQLRENSKIFKLRIADLLPWGLQFDRLQVN